MRQKRAAQRKPSGLQRKKDAADDAQRHTFSGLAVATVFVHVFHLRIVLQFCLYPLFTIRRFCAFVNPDASNNAHQT